MLSCGVWLEFKRRFTIWWRPLIPTIVLIAISPTFTAQGQTPPKPLRFDFTPLIGYRTSMSFDNGPQVQPVGATGPRVVLDASPSYGFSLGMRLDEENLVEFRWARQDTHIHFDNSVPVTFRQHVTLDEVHGDFTHEYILEDWHKWARPFITGSVGATHISGGGGNSGFTRFSFGLATGLKFYPSRHLGFRIQAAWLPVWASPEVAFVCGGGCIVHFGGNVASQGEVTVGPLLRF